MNISIDVIFLLCACSSLFGFVLCSIVNACEDIAFIKKIHYINNYDKIDELDSKYKFLRRSKKWKFIL